MIATASAKTSEMIIAGRILDAADGFRPNARIEANPMAAITTDGPRIVKNMTNRMTTLRIF